MRARSRSFGEPWKEREVWFVCFHVGGWRMMHENGLGGRWKSKHGGTEVNTGVCIVCGERAGSVAILRIAPRRFCFRSRCPDRFLPPTCATPCLLLLRPALYAPFVSPPRLFREFSRAGETQPWSLSADKGNLVYPSTPSHHPHFAIDLFLSFIPHRD